MSAQTNITQDKIEAIRKHLLRGLPLTAAQSFTMYGYMRLAAGIHQLRRKGWDINTTEKTGSDGSRYAEYKLISKPVNSGK